MTGQMCLLFTLPFINADRLIESAALILEAVGREAVFLKHLKSQECSACCFLEQFSHSALST
jgi:hypothetical protein